MGNPSVTVSLHKGNDTGTFPCHEVFRSRAISKKLLHIQHIILVLALDIYFYSEMHYR